MVLYGDTDLNKSVVSSLAPGKYIAPWHRSIAGTRSAVFTVVDYLKANLSSLVTTLILALTGYYKVDPVTELGFQLQYAVTDSENQRKAVYRE